jgi:hypothetical protein
VTSEIAGLSSAVQAQLSADLLVEMERTNVRPTLHERLQSGGWQHSLVLQEMIRWY